jgi:radical SAM protein
MPYSTQDFDHSPFLVFYEVTRACDLACRHCRASAQKNPNPLELDTDRSKELITQMASFPKKPMLVFTGGDPLKRRELPELTRHAASLGLRVALTPSATDLVTQEALAELKQAGVSRLAVSLDGADAETHDQMRGFSGSFERTLEIMGYARSLGIPMQINTTISKRNHRQIDAIADLLDTQEIVLWSAFFLIPVGRGVRETRLSANECEEVFERLWYQAQRRSYGIKTTEAHHYRRYAMQQQGDPRNPKRLLGRPVQDPTLPDAPIQRAPLGVNDGKGVMFVSHIGEIYPSGFMPILCGEFPKDSIVDVYQNQATFRSLRDPDGFHGKCGVCEYRHVCGGSRARAYAVTGDPLGAEPDCVYIPEGWRDEANPC